MDIITIVLIANGLSMDCFAVSIAKAGTLNKFDFGKFFAMALLFGVFQGFMPFIGYLLGYNFAAYIESVDHWLALLILSIIGGKMIFEDLKPKNINEDIAEKNPYSIQTLLLLSVATSIDALATGLVFIPYKEWLWIAISVIAIVSFVFSFAGSMLGLFFGKKFSFKFGIVGGIILIAIGVKIVIQHCCL